MRPQYMRKDFKLHFLKDAIAALFVHAMAIKTVTLGGNVAMQINWRLIVKVAFGPTLVATIKARVCEIVANVGRQLVPRRRPTRL
jgi:hypothetical protein